MKRVMLALLGLLCAAALIAQNRQQLRTQRGNATQEIQAEGLSAAHNNIPLGSKAWVKNPANGREIEVTIVQQIPASPQRAIDLSPAAALALDLRFGGPVEITPLFQPQDPPPVVEAGAGTDTEKSPVPFNVIINNYVTNSEVQKPPPPKDRPEVPVQNNSFAQEPPRNTAQDPIIEPEIPKLSAPPPNAQQPSTQPPNPVVELSAVQASAQPEAPPPPPPPVQEAPPPVQEAPPPEAPPPPVVQEAPPAKPPLFTMPPVYNIRIIPDRLPDPNTNRVYRLLVGTYPGLDSAFPIYRQLQAAGFQVEQEQAGEMCRVFAAGIPASQVYYAAQRLGAIGFEQVWIHE